MGRRTILSIIIISLGFGIFGLGVYTFHYFYHPIFTMLCAGMGSLLIDLGVMYHCELEGRISEILRIGPKKTGNIEKPAIESPS